MNSQELKSCPFCKSTDLDDYSSEDTESSCVSCLKCKATLPPWLDATSARNAWNTRPIEDRQAAQIEALKELVRAQYEEARVERHSASEWERTSREVAEEHGVELLLTGPLARTREEARMKSDYLRAKCRELGLEV